MTRLINPMGRFGPGRIDPIPLDEAVHRLRVFCTSTGSGWGVYDLAGHHARLQGAFETVSATSLLWADALAGRVSVGDLATFNDNRAKFAELVASIDAGRDLHTMGQAELGRVVALCQFGFKGAWAPKITKVAALYRPRAVPVLDGYVAMAFGFERHGFSAGAGGPRVKRIERVVAAIHDWLAQHRDALAEIRDGISSVVPDHEIASDVRLLDIVLWTSADDRISRTGKAANAWLNDSPKEPIRAAQFEPIRVG